MAQSGESLGRAVLDLVVEKTKYGQDMKRAEAEAEKLDKAFKKTSESAKTSGDSIKGLLTVTAKFAVAGAAVGTTLIALAKSAANYADEMGKAAQRTGVQIEALSGLRYAADLADVDFNSLQTGLQRFSRTVIEAARGTDQATRSFKTLGISIRDQQGNLKSTEELLLELADRFAAMPDGPIKTALAMEVLGRSGAQLITMLNAGSIGIKELTEEARRLGLEITSETARAAEQFNDDIRRLQLSVRGLTVAIGTPLIGALQRLLTALTTLVQSPAFRELNRGFWRGISAGLGDEVALAEQQLMRLRHLRQSLDRPMPIPGGGTLGLGIDRKRLDEDIAAVEQHIKRLKEQRDNAAKLFGGNTKDPRIEDTKAEDERKRKIDALTNSLKSMNEQLFLQEKGITGGESAVILERAKIFAEQAKELGASTPLAPLIEEFKKLSFAIIDAELAAKKYQETARMMDQDSTEWANASAEVQTMILQPAAQKTAEELRKIKAEFDALMASAQTPAQKMADQMSRLHQLLAAEQITVEQYREAWKILGDQQRDSLSSLQGALMNLGQAAGDAFGRAIASGQDFRGVLQGLLSDLIRIAQQLATEEIKSALMGGGGGGGSIFSGLLGGGGGGIGNLFSGLGGFGARPLASKAQ